MLIIEGIFDVNLSSYKGDKRGLALCLETGYAPVSLHTFSVARATLFAMVKT